MNQRISRSILVVFLLINYSYSSNNTEDVTCPKNTFKNAAGKCLTCNLLIPHCKTCSVNLECHSCVSNYVLHVTLTSDKVEIQKCDGKPFMISLWGIVFLGVGSVALGIVMSCLVCALSKCIFKKRRKNKSRVRVHPISQKPTNAIRKNRTRHKSLDDFNRQPFDPSLPVESEVYLKGRELDSTVILPTNQSEANFKLPPLNQGINKNLEIHLPQQLDEEKRHSQDSSKLDRFLAETKKKTNPQIAKISRKPNRNYSAVDRLPSIRQKGGISLHFQTKQIVEEEEDGYQESEENQDDESDMAENRDSSLDSI